MATDNFWGKFRRWRRHRPFWGGLFLILSAVELFLSANMSLGGIEVHIGPQGFLSYLLPVIIVVCGLLCWFTPQQRLFYGIVSLLAALYSFIGLNLGGFFVGMLLGIVGGALVIAWGPPKSRPGTPAAEPPTGEPTDHHEDQPVDVGDDIFGPHDEHEDIEQTQQIEVAGHDDRPRDEPPVRSASFAALPPAARRAGPALRRKVIALALVPVAVAATIVVGSNLPASADVECPEGLPSRSVPASSGPTSAAASSAAASSPAADTPATTTAAGKTTEAAKPTTGAATTPTTAVPTDDGGNPISDAVTGLVDGVSNLLGIGDGESTPSTSPATSEPSTPATTAPAETSKAADPAKPADPPKPADPAKPAGPAKGAAAETTEATADPSSTDDEIPCLGPRVFGKLASADDLPIVAKTPGTMEVDSLTLYDSTYDGVVDMPTAGGGSYKALKFSMDKATNKPFSLTIAEPSGTKTVITSKSLTTTGTVKFYTSRLEGKLFGLIPVVFTPQKPPPLTLPILWFTDVTIQLSFVRCDTLTGDPLRVQG